MRALVVTSLLVSLAGPSIVATQAAPAAADLAARVQARFAAVRDFTAEFTQTETSPLLPRPVVERGQVKVKKPGKMRWTYTSGDKKVFVSDGVRVYMHYPQDRYVEEFRVDKDASTGLMFLAGRLDLVRDFVASMPSAQPAGEWHLELTPKKKDADLVTLTLAVERVSLGLRGFKIVDDQEGVRTFRLTKLEENRNLPDSDFVFVMPRNVELRRQ